jgi:hypothetical protein
MKQKTPGSAPVLSLKMAFSGAPFYPQWKNYHAHRKEKGPQKKSMLPQEKGPFPKRKFAAEMEIPHSGRMPENRAAASFSEGRFPNTEYIVLYCLF